MKKWMLSLILSVFCLNSVGNKICKKVDIYNLQKNKKYNLFYFKNTENKIVSIFSVNSIKRLGSNLEVKIDKDWEDNNYITIDMPNQAILDLSYYINFYKKPKQREVENIIIESLYVLDILFFAQKYQIKSLEELILKNLPYLIVKHKLMKKLQCGSYQDLIEKLNIDSKEFRKFLENNKKYYIELLKCSQKDLISNASNGVYDITFSYNNKYLAAGFDNGEVKLYDLDTQEEKTVITHDSWVINIAFSKDNNYLATCSGDKQIKVYDIIKNKQSYVFYNDSEVASIEFSNNCKYLAIACKNGKVKICDLNNLKVKTIVKYDSWACFVKFSANSKYLSSCSKCGKVSIYNLETNEFKKNIVTRFPVFNISFSPDSKYLAFYEKNKVKVYDIDRDKIKTVVSHDYLASKVEFSPNGKYLISGSSDGFLKIYDFNKSSLIVAHNARINNIVITENNKYIVTCSNDNTVKVYDMKAKKLKKIITHNDYVYNVALSQNNKYLASCSKDGKVKLLGDCRHLSDEQIFDTALKKEQKENSILSKCVIS